MSEKGKYFCLGKKVYGIQPDEYDRADTRFTPTELYWAIQGVFEVPNLDVLIDPEKLKSYFESWADDPLYKGPAVYYNEHGVPTKIVTDTSGRIITVAWRDRTRATLPPIYVEVEFPRGSRYAAGKVVEGLVSAGKKGGRVDFGTDENHHAIEPGKIEDCVVETRSTESK